MLVRPTKIKGAKLELGCTKHHFSLPSCANDYGYLY